MDNHPKMSCFDFQSLLSAMLDAQVTDNEASGAMLHLEHCSDCAEFFGAIRLQALAHNELHAHQFDVAKCSISAVKEFFGDCDDAQIVRRLARALYQLGKAYTLIAASEDSYLLSVSEAPVDIEDFVGSEAFSALADAQLAGTHSSEKISLPTGKKHALAKGRSLLEQCLALKPQYSEANLYLGQIHVHLQDFEQAFAQFERVFKGSERLVMRVHAAMQIAMVFNEQQNHKAALRYYRWIVASGILELDTTFGFVFHNIAMQHQQLNDEQYAQRALELYRQYDFEGWKQSLEMLGEN